MNKIRVRLGKNHVLLRKPKCPHCGMPFGATFCSEFSNQSDTVSENGYDIPQPGSITICVGCGEISQFTEGMGLRIAPEEALAEIKADERAWQIIERIKKLFAERK